MGEQDLACPVQGKAGNKQFRENVLAGTSMVSMWILHPPVLEAAGQCPRACLGVGPAFPSHPTQALPRLCLWAQVFRWKKEWSWPSWKGRAWMWPGRSREPMASSSSSSSSSSFSSHVHPGGLLLQVPPLSPFLQACPPPGCPFSSWEWSGWELEEAPAHLLMGTPGDAPGTGAPEGLCFVGHKWLLRTSPTPWVPPSPEGREGQPPALLPEGLTRLLPPLWHCQDPAPTGWGWCPSLPIHPSIPPSPGSPRMPGAPGSPSRACHVLPGSYRGPTGVPPASPLFGFFTWGVVGWGGSGAQTLTEGAKAGLGSADLAQFYM
ncbi:peroxisome proliferator-activated receptor gamma coactivator-related protein 1-like [Corapipo altera]|uniref:peroxisome proliferator-activated receptor gamma coactivator-related protein 1-like n=1 Tax=Corapipo altera TaxID=415028 RepID=UPI000FD68C0C|nr:peroxisome proliferator-activated receptor gamma coactivator-related protein 1-like [Corapipo altera]